MLHIDIIALGFLALMVQAILAFKKVRRPGHTLAETVCATAFGVGFFGFLSAIYIGVSYSSGLRLVWIGGCWLTIINGSLSCMLATAFDEISRGQRP